MTSTFNFVAGHAENHEWLDAATIAYAASMSVSKYASHPSSSQTPRDAAWVNNGYPEAAKSLEFLNCNGRQFDVVSRPSQ
jgi:hypothetical protein